MHGKWRLWFLLSVSMVVLTSSAAAFESAYTSLTPQQDGGECRLIRSASPPGASWAQWQCPGFAAYLVLLTTDDARSWPIITVGKQKFDLLDEVIQHTPGSFPTVQGAPMEWRFDAATRKPHAIIFRMEYQAPPESGRHKTILLVATVRHDRICVVGRTTANEEARRLADQRLPCPP